jgi:hypothetical protein
VELRREKRIEKPDRFPYSVLVTIQPRRDQRRSGVRRRGRLAQRA